jgi:hypothetical protein
MSEYIASMPAKQIPNMAVTGIKLTVFDRDKQRRQLSRILRCCDSMTDTR